MVGPLIYTADPMQANPNSQHHANDEANLLRLATYASVLTALTLVLAKAWAWHDTGAVSLLASLIDSLMDGGASIVNLLAVRYALKPADANHRFGHGKAEALAALLQCMLILVSCAYLSLEAVQRFSEPRDLASIDSGIAVILFSLAATTGLLILQRYVIRKTHSTAIRADSLHYASDLAANLATLLALWLAASGMPLADPVLALAIALWLLLSTRHILRDALDELLDRELPDEERQVIISIAREHPDVIGVHDVRTRRSGRAQIIQLHLELNPELNLKRAHAIADEVERRLHTQLPNADIVIHQDPAGVGERRRWIESHSTE